MQNVLTIGKISFERISSGNQSQIEIVQKILEKAPQYYLLVEGVSEVPEHMAEREIDGVPENRKPTYEKHFLIISLDDLPMGVADLHKDHPEEQSTYIGLFLLDQKYQGKGWGTKIYAQLEMYCREDMNATRIALGVADENAVSLFWEKMGFGYSGRTYTWTGENKKVNVKEMEKSLAIELRK